MELVQSKVKGQAGLSLEREWENIKWSEKSGRCTPIHCHLESGGCCCLVPFGKGNTEISAIAVRIVVK